MSATATMAKEPRVKYPLDLEPELYRVASDEAKENEQSLAGYIRKLVKQDLIAKGKWPVKG